MIETDETGQEQVRELLASQNDPVFNDWEKTFIRDLQRTTYAKLSKHQKAVVTRLIGWLRGEK